LQLNNVILLYFQNPSSTPVIEKDGDCANTSVGKMNLEISNKDQPCSVNLGDDVGQLVASCNNDLVVEVEKCLRTTSWAAQFDLLLNDNAGVATFSVCLISHIYFFFHKNAHAFIKIFY